MSEAVRAVALAEATKLKGDTGDSSAVLETAALYLNFLQGGAFSPTSSAAGAEPEKKAATPPAGTKKATATATDKATTKAAVKAATEAAAAKAALAAANAETGDESTGPSEPFTADAEGVSGAVAAMIANKTGEGPNRDTAIALLKKYKASSVSAMQKQAAEAVAKFIGEVNEAFGLSGGEPDLES